ncbi:uncharacterized protein LOC135652658 [Musa acuminata AAA Group]|uniref:(wild Malaysian banana) hypothetical protein n=1 Tax=Musa acuminata subsp. malaccensis TaxID=214687 RepID=A0A804L2P8_MUSAM|nr:PREDICTED: uncharacterized protein LOC103970063 [Musa acuminata subsp. malaccensis]CAG1863138.1 unnamed protein product [Musa acuminata subsp. malaccensis]
MAFALPSYTLVVFFLSSLLLLHFGDARRHHAVVRLQARSPHGLAFQEPMPFPPTAFEFFHPKLLLPPASAPMPLASSSFYPAATSAKVRADEEVEAAGEHSSPAGSGGVGASGVAAVVLGLALVVIAAMLASYVVVVRRRSDVRRAKGTVQPDA